MKLASLSLGAAVLGILVVSVAWFSVRPQTRSSKIPAAAVEAKVSHVIDAYTIKVDISGKGAAAVRYIGIDTPDDVDPRLLSEEMDQVTAVKNDELVDGKSVYLEQDVSDTDQAGHLLRYVYLADGLLVNQELVRRGFAQAIPAPPNTKYQELLRAAEQEARNSLRGFWGPVEAYDPTLEQIPQLPPIPSSSSTTR
jgi:micrococcal nuclease